MGLFLPNVKFVIEPFWFKHRFFGEWTWLCSIANIKRCAGYIKTDNLYLRISLEYINGVLMAVLVYSLPSVDALKWLPCFIKTCASSKQLRWVSKGCFEYTKVKVMLWWVHCRMIQLVWLCYDVTCWCVWMRQEKLCWFMRQMFWFYKGHFSHQTYAGGLKVVLMF